MHQQPDVLTSALQTAALCLFIVLMMALGNRIDRSREVEDAQAADRAQQARAVQAARQAYQQGLDDGAERELFRQQQRLAAMEPQP
jgi:hypothetical protein